MSKSDRLQGRMPSLPTLIGVAAGVVAVLLAVYYVLFPAKGYYHSDCADTILWAQASLDAGSLYNSDFTYACLLPFGGELLMLPFVALWGVSYTAHAAGMLLFLLLLTASLVWLCRTLGLSVGWTGTAVASTFGILCTSEKLREIFFGHIIYYSLGCLFLAVGLSLLLHADAAHGLERICWLCITGGWFLLCALNGLPSLALFTVPALVGFYGERFADTSLRFRSREHRVSLVTAGAAAGGSLIGWLLGSLLGKNVVAGYENAFSGFSASRTWSTNLDNFLPHWTSLLGADVTGKEKFMSLEGISALLRIGLGLVLLVAPFIGFFFWKKLHRPTRVFLLSHATVSGILLFAFTFGSLSGASWRLSPMIFTAAVSCTLLAHELWQRRTKRFGALLQSCVALLAAIGILSVATMPYNYKRDEGYQGLAAYLQEQGLTYGYATFWNAGVITVLSDSEVQVRNVELQNGTIQPYTYQSQKQWFTDQGASERYFLLLTSQEYSTLQTSGSSLLLKVTGRLDYGDYVILLLSSCPF